MIKTQKLQIWQDSECGKNPKMWQNSNTQNLKTKKKCDKTQNSQCDKIKKKTWNMTKPKNSKCGKTQKLKMEKEKNSKT